MSPAKKTTRKTARKTARKKKTKKTARKKAPASKAGTAKKKATPAKKKASPAQKKTTRKKAAPRPAAAKKKTLRPAPVIKKAAKAAPEAKKKLTKAPAGQAARAKRARSRRAAAPAAPPVEAHPKLGVKHTCFTCGAKFYDLFRPEPLCPKCGADQREAPKTPAKPKPVAKRKRGKKRSMAPLLDDDEDQVFEDDRAPELDLKHTGAAFDDPAAVGDDES